MNIPQIESILFIGTIIYPSIKTYKLYQKIKLGYVERYAILKILCYTLFYEPFFIYDVIKFGIKKTDKHLMDKRK